MTRVEVHSWFERDRAHVEVRNADTQETLLEWWDEAVTEAFEDGFLSARNLQETAAAYAEYVGALSKPYRLVAVGSDE